METGDLPRALDALLDGREPGCAPWWCWLGVALCRQRVAQAWLVGVAPTLGGEDGDVPGHPGWRAEFHGKGLCLEGPRGALVDMDFGNHAGEDIDPWFFASRVRVMHDGAEAHVRRWLGSDAVLVAALEALRRDGHLWHPTSRHVFRLSAPLEAMAARVAHAAEGAVERVEPAALRAAMHAAGAVERIEPAALRAAMHAEGAVERVDPAALCEANAVAEESSGEDAPRAVSEPGTRDERGALREHAAPNAVRTSRGGTAVPERCEPSGAGTARDGRASFVDLLERSGAVPGEGAHAQWLAGLLSDRERAARMVPTVANLLRRDAFVSLLPGLLRTADHLAAATLEQCDALGVDATALVAPLLPHVTDGRHPYIGVQVCRHLLRRDVETAGALAAVRSLAAVVQVKGFTGNPMLDHLAFLLLEFGDELEARRVVRRALRGVPACAEAVAVLLSLLRTRWALDELRSVVGDSSLEGPFRRRAAIALRMAGVVAEAPPAAGSAGVGFTFDEVDAARLADQGLLIPPELRSLAERLGRQ